MIPIAWSLSDPIFRSAVQSGKLNLLGSTVPLKNAFSAAKYLRCEYVLVVETKLNQGQLLSKSQLYDHEHLIWVDPEAVDAPAPKMAGTNLNRIKLTKEQRQQIENERAADRKRMNQYQSTVGYRSTALELNGSANEEGTSASLARTLVTVLDSGPFRAMAVNLVTPDPGAAPGPVSLIESSPEIPVAQDKATFQANLADAEKSAHPDIILTVLRDGVDSAPFDVDRRILLVKNLIFQNEISVAAAEAKSACDLSPKSVKLHLLKGETDLRLGQANDAASEAQIALTLEPQNNEALILQARSLLGQGKLNEAITIFSSASQASSTGNNLAYLAVCQAISGDDKNAQVTWATAVAKKESVSYPDLVAMVDDSSLAASARLRDLFTAAITKNPQVDVKSETNKIQAVETAEFNLVSLFSPDQEYQKSNDSRVLALTLLIQTASELALYNSSRSDEDLSAGRISLGESIHQLKTAASLLKVDNQNGSTGSDINN